MIPLSSERGATTGPAPGSSPRGGASIISRSSLAEAIAEPCRVLIRSAPAMEVESPRATSWVTCTPPTGTVSTCARVPARNTAADVEPPPMSMQTEPRSISSSSSAASADTNGAATTPSSCRWARSTQAPRVLNTVSATDTTSNSTPSVLPNMARGSRTPPCPSTDQPIGMMWIARRPGSFIWASAFWIARRASLSPIGRAPMETRPATRDELIWPAVATVTPWMLTPATFSARSTAWAIASEASSRLTIEPPLTPRDCT